MSLETSPLFDALMLGVADEVYLIDAKTMQLSAVSDSAIRRMDIGLQAMRKMRMQKLLGLSEKKLAVFAEKHSSQPAKFFEFPELDELSLSYIRHNKHPYIVAVKSGLSSAKARALAESRSRFKALVTNTPGLVFEFLLNAKQELMFGYLSEGCKALLDIESEVLKKAPQKFFDLIDKSDRALLKKNIRASASVLKTLNWEGRVWIEAWQDIKWVNLRATPKKLANGIVQWQGIMTNITQSKNERFELEQSRRRLSELSAHLQYIKEEERGRIAREIHDDLGGNLTAIKIGLSSILKKLPQDQLALIEKAKGLEAIVDSTFEAAHRISGDLRPNILELGVVAALEWQAKEFEKQMDIPCFFTANHHAEIAETNEQAITLFRICQEAMSNIAKYANAKRVDVALTFSQNEIMMTIIDDGVGIDTGDMLKPNSFGLRGMAERVAALGGRFLIGKVSDKGTKISVSLPIQNGGT